MLHLKMITCCTVAFLALTTANAQFGALNKLKNKADKMLEKKVDSAFGIDNNNSNNSDMSSVGRNGKPANKTGEGLISSPPNVNENLATAESSFKANKFGDARYAVRQAMLGVEMEIGKKILQGLPATVSGLPKDTTSDKVTSSGWGQGWSGLTIQRDYVKDDKQLSFTIANNAAWMQTMNLYLNNNAYMQTSDADQKWKQIRVQDEKAIIQFDASSGYKLSVPVGQTTLLVYEGVNFANEQEFMNAVNQIKIPSIKQQLGEK